MVIPSFEFNSDLSKLRSDFEQNGFVRIENVFTESEIEEMKAAMSGIVANWDPDSLPKSVFSTEDEEKHTADRYFLDSSANISFFYEEGALDSNGCLKVPKEKALNKVGHALHWINPIFRKFTFSEKIQRIIKSLKFQKPKVVQSMYIFKQPKIGGAVTDHIDATFLRSSPIEHLVGLWIGLDEATEKNGCLWFIPKSHKNPPNPDYRFVRTLSAEPPLLKFLGQKPVYDSKDFVAVPVAKGSLVLIHGLVVHKSEPNYSTESRHSFTLHVAESGDKWDPLNWLQETDDYKFPFLFSE